ncbi:MAG TPA: NAD-dependent epimerase/dehydratase family protein [Pseudolabrys sp.]|nr:NAD-dependent epimerase/dehydratase family protein [Pseudolabrys sp.]
MTTIALTGGTGFIGRQLMRDLSQRGFKVRVLLRRPTDVPLHCDSALIGDLTRPQNLAAAFADAEAVVHSAGTAHAMSGIPADDYRAINTEGTIALARAAERAGVRRFVFLSSIRAQSGPHAAEILTEALEPRPTDAYGRSKLAAEHGLAQLGMDWVALRPVLVYGPGAKGNMAALAALARSPYPLPLAGLQAKRSLLALDNLATAVAHVLAAPGPLRRPFIVADSDAVSVPQMIAAMRAATGRRPGLVPVPEALIKSALTWSGRREWIDRLCAPLVVSTAALQEVGWTPQVSTRAGLAAFAAAP